MNVESTKFGVASEVAALCAIAVFVALLSWFKLGDVDSGYHIAYGRQFLSTGHIVTRDPFLYPENASDFINANWGAQVIMAAVERVAGAGGLVALRSALLLIVFACVVGIIRALTQSWHAVAWGALLAALGAYERFSMRPELFSHALLAILIFVLVRGGAIRNQLIGLGILQVLWVNLHSYFIVGPMVTSMMLVGEALAFVLPISGKFKFRINLTRIKERTYELVLIPEANRIRFFVLLLGVQAFACTVNPWNVRGAVFPISTLSDLSRHDVIASTNQPNKAHAWSEISEFHSPFAPSALPHICGRTIDVYYLLLAVATLGIVALASVGRFGEAVVILLLVAMSMQMRRNIAQFALVAAPLAVAALQVVLSNRLALLRQTGRVLSAVCALLLAGWWSAGIVSGRFYYDERRITREFGNGYSDVTFLRDAVTWLDRHDAIQPNLFVDYFSSSNTLLWLPEQFKLFVDTNTFAYPEPVLRAAFDVGLGKVDHKAFLDEHGINVVLLHAGPDTQVLIRRLALDVANWSPVYFDPHAVIYARRIPAHEALIRDNLPREDQLNPADWIARARGGRYHRALAIGTMLNVPMSTNWWTAGAALADEAIRLAPDYHEAWYHKAVAEGNLAKAAARRSDWEEMRRRCRVAVEAAETVLQYVPDHREAKIMRDELRRTLMLYSGVGH